MIKEKLQKRIDVRFEGMKESLKYIIEAQCELLSGLQYIQDLLYLTNTKDDNTN